MLRYMIFWIGLSTTYAMIASAVFFVVIPIYSALNSPLIIAVISAYLLVSCLLFISLKQSLEKLIFKKKYRCIQSLRRLTNKTINLQDLTVFWKHVHEELSLFFDCNHCAFYLDEHDSGTYYQQLQHSPFRNRAIHEPFDSFSQTQDLQSLLNSHANTKGPFLLLPIRQKQRDIAFIVMGPPLHGRDCDMDERKYLEKLSITVSAALNNTLLYSTVLKNNDTLKIQGPLEVEHISLTEKEEQARQLTYFISKGVQSSLQGINESIIHLSKQSLDELNTNNAMLKQIKETCESLYTFSKKYLYYSKLSSTQKQHHSLPVQLDRIIKTAIKQLSGTYSDDELRIHYECNVVDPRIMADDEQLLMLYKELIENAILHGDTQSPIHVGIHQHDKDIVTIINNEGPLSHTVRDRLSQKPSNPNAVHQHDISSGLGLLICNKIIQNHQSSVSVNNDTHQTVIRISWPNIPAYL